MLRPVALTLTLAAVALAACGDERKPLPAACTGDVEPIVKALERAPAPVRLSDGTRLSTCVERAFSDAQIQEVGLVLTRAADLIAVGAQASDAAALQLGYLVAAARRGGAHTQGIHAELVRRLEAAAGIDGLLVVRRGAYERGVAAGRRSG